jgi:hypothetical protein
MNIEGKNYYATITDTADSTLTFAALAGDAAPSAGTRYQILLGMVGRLRLKGEGFYADSKMCAM